MKLILRQIGPGRAEVTCHSEQNVEVMFTGSRVAAKNYIKMIRTCVGWENVPAFCEKKRRKYCPARLVEIP